MDFIGLEGKKNLFTFGKFNIVTGGCGTGKTYWALNTLPDMFGLKREEVMLVTSRRLAAEQLGSNKKAKCVFIEHEDDFTRAKGVMPVMTYNMFERLLYRETGFAYRSFPDFKAFVFDECHSLILDNYNIACRTTKEFIKERCADYLMIGLTATPQIFEAYRNKDDSIVYVNDPFFNYRSQRMTVLKGDDNLCAYIDQLEGRTLVMCTSKSYCEYVAKHIKRPSAMLYGVDDQDRREDMKYLADYIATNSSLPATDYEGKPFDVLIGTSALREGYTLKPESGIRNVISCYADAPSFIQLIGRARYNLDNVAIADCGYQYGRNSLFFSKQQVRLFRSFIKGKYNNGWYNNVAAATGVPLAAIETFEASSATNRFIEEMKIEGFINTDIFARTAQAAKVVALAEQCNLFKGTGVKKYTFNGVRKYIAEQTDYKAVTQRKLVKRKLKTCWRFEGDETRYKPVCTFGLLVPESERANIDSKPTTTKLSEHFNEPILTDVRDINVTDEQFLLEEAAYYQQEYDETYGGYYE